MTNFPPVMSGSGGRHVPQAIATYHKRSPRTTSGRHVPQAVATYHKRSPRTTSGRHVSKVSSRAGVSITAQADPDPATRAARGADPTREATTAHPTGLRPDGQTAGPGESHQGCDDESP